MQNVWIAMLALSGASQNWAGDALGFWKVNPARSSARYSNIESVGFQRHAKGEVFTLYRFDTKGRATTSSTILYFDSGTRDLQDFGCSGTQSSRRVDSQTVEILRTCANGSWIRFVRRSSTKPNELVLEITEQRAGGRSFESHLELEKLR
jgi:hypothetical protein